MSIESYGQLLRFKEVGRICHLALRAMAAFVRAGMTTRAVADVGAKVMRKNGARSAPAMVYGFPGEISISVNDEVVHGIPGETFEKNRSMADAAITVPVEPVADEARRLTLCAERAFQQAMRVAKAPNRVNEIGRAVEREVQQSGFSVIRALGGTASVTRFTSRPAFPTTPTFRRASA